jgi:ATP-binding cassette, subfamily B, bacterial MsbA
MKKLRIFRRFDPRLAAELRTQRRPILIGLICTAVASTLYASIITLTGTATSAVETLANLGHQTPKSSPEAFHQPMATLGWTCLIVIGIFGARYWFMRGQTYYLSYASNRLAGDLRKKLFAKLMRLPVSYFSERRAGAIQSVLSNDVNVYQNAVGIIRDSIEGPIKAIGAFAAILFMQPYLAVIAFLMIPLMVAIIQRNSRKVRKAQMQVQDDLAGVSATAQEVLQGTRVVKAFGAEGKMDQQFGEIVEKGFRSQMKAVATLASLRPLVDLIGAIALAGVLYVGGILASQGKLRVADITALAIAMDVINQGFRSLANVSNTYATVQAASKRIHEQVLDVPEEHIDVQGAVEIESPIGRIEFKDVSFCYPDGTPALESVSFIIEPGTSLALVGPSGAGKSTIADLMLRFYDPTSGSIYFDGTDIRQLKVDWLRSQIGVVPQHTFLFAGTIGDNIRMGASDATYDDVAQAGSLAHAEEFVSRFEHRYNAEIGETGAGLSGGERQRVAIARALVRKPTMLLLDEATSALDATSEKAVTAALEEVMHSRTTLFIAHRLTTAARADKILYLRRGEVIEYGSHKELMDRNGEYAALFRVFSSGLLEEMP